MTRFRPRRWIEQMEKAGAILTPDSIIRPGQLVVRIDVPVLTARVADLFAEINGQPADAARRIRAVRESLYWRDYDRRLHKPQAAST